jgi:hypothetical protein
MFCSGDVVVQNEADSELGKALIKAAKQKGFTTINILANKPGVNDSIELLKSIGGDVVVTEAYTNTWFELPSHSDFFLSLLFFCLDIRQCWDRKPEVGSRLSSCMSPFIFVWNCRESVPVNLTLGVCCATNIGFSHELKFCRYMKRLISDLPKPSVGINCGEGSQATAVVKLLKQGGTLLTYGTSLPQEVAYPGAERRPLKWNDLLKGKKLNVQSLWGPIRSILMETPPHVIAIIRDSLEIRVVLVCNAPLKYRRIVLSGKREEMRRLSFTCEPEWFGIAPALDTGAWSLNSEMCLRHCDWNWSFRCQFACVDEDLVFSLGVFEERMQLYEVSTCRGCDLTLM